MIFTNNTKYIYPLFVSENRAEHSMNDLHWLDRF